MRSFAIAISYVMLAGALACTTTASDDRFVQTSLPDRGSFGPASALLDVRCGSTDCHGNVARNLRLYGSAGLRLSSSDRSLDPLCNTQDEITQDYISVIGLEPEIISAVAAGGDPGTLTIVRKARGTEAHKGDQIWTTGDDSDVCLTSWLTGAANTAACSRALASVLPGGSQNPLTQCAPP